VIDEVVLHELLGRLGDEVTVPPGGPARVVDAARRVAPRPRRRTVKVTDVLAVAAAILVVVGLGAVVVVSGNSNGGNASKSSSVQSRNNSLIGRPATTVPCSRRGPACLLAASRATRHRRTRSRRRRPTRPRS